MSKAKRNTKGTTARFIRELSLATQGKKIERYGRPFRGGWTEIALGKTELTLAALKKAVRNALTSSGCHAQQPSLFCTRKISETSDIEFYVTGNDWNAVIELGGTQKNAWMNVSFSGR